MTSLRVVTPTIISLLFPFISSVIKIKLWHRIGVVGVELQLHPCFHAGDEYSKYHNNDRNLSSSKTFFPVYVFTPVLNSEIVKLDPLRSIITLDRGEEGKL
jgi:hypothetical protein